MNNQSEQINELAKALSKCQKENDRFTGMSFNGIAEIMGVSAMTIHRAYTGKSWRNNENI